MLTLLVILIVLALVVPLLGVQLDPNIMRIVAVMLVVFLLVWLFAGGIPSLR